VRALRLKLLLHRSRPSASALPGSAVKGVGNAAKFGVNATTFVAKGATQGAGKAAKVKYLLYWL